MNSTAFLIGEKIYLRKLRDEDINESYLAWLNDPIVLEYRESSSRIYPTSMDDLRSWYEKFKKGSDLHFAICLRDSDKHVGNLSLDNILWIHRRAALNILLGDRSVWGKGHGTEAVKLLTRHAFLNMGLRQVWAESPNPGFNKIVRKLGWIKEGVKREAFLHHGRFIDYECHSILFDEWMKLNANEKR